MILSCMLALIIPIVSNNDLLPKNEQNNEKIKHESFKDDRAGGWRHLGNRSIEMFQELDEGVLLEYEKSKLSLTHLNEEYQIVTGELHQFSRFPTVFIGSYPIGREIISLNPADSPLLDVFYQNFINSLSAGASTEEILEGLKDFINEEVFIPEISNETQLNSFINQWCFDRERSIQDFSLTIDEHYLPVISVEDFISIGIGVCRHYAYATAYFLDRLSDEGYIHGKGYLVRDLVSSRTAIGGHAWNLFITENGKEAWHLDTYWELLENCNDPEGLRALCYRYGSTAIENQLTRFIK